MKQNKLMKLLFGGFLLAGVLTLILGVVVLYKGKSVAANAVEVEATITDIQTYRGTDGEKDHSVVIEYEFEGQNYSVEINAYNSSMYEGKTLPILINPKAPRKVYMEEDFMVLSMIPILIGTIFSLIGGIALIVMHCGKKKQERLRQNGKRIQATVEEITFNYNVHVNGRCPYIIICLYKDESTGISYRFKSPNIWTNPNLVFQPGSYIDVWVDPNDYSKHFVDAQEQLEKKVVDFT